MASTQKSSLLSAHHRRAILISLLVSATAYLAVVFYSEPEKVTTAFTSLGFSGWIFILTCSLINYYLRYLRWQYYIRRTGWHIKHRTHFLYYLTGFALTTTPGKAGETIRSLLLRPHGVPYPVSLACFITERFLDVIVIAILASLTMTIFNEYRGFVLFTTALILLCLPAIRSPLPGWLLHKLDKTLKIAWLHKLILHGMSLLKHAQQFLSWQLIFSGLTIGFIAWLVQGLAFFFIVHSLGLQIGVIAAMGIYAISLLAGAVSFIPGGVGTTEIVMGLLLSLLGAAPAVAIAAPLISRLSTLWFAVLLGLLSSSWLSVHHNRARMDKSVESDG